MVTPFLSGCSSGPSSISGNDVGDYTIFTPEVATDVMQQLYTRANYTRQSLKLNTVITTRAGTFYIDASEVSSLKVALDRVDTNDDNVIDQIEMQAQFEIIIERLGPFPFFEPEKLGLPLKFNSFSPSTAWLDNQSILAAEIEKGNISYFWYDVGRSSSKHNLFQITTTATQAGWTPDLFEYASQYCNSDNNCQLKYLSHTYDFNPGVSTPTSIPFIIGLGLWDGADIESIDISMVHEHGHEIYSSISKKNGKPKLLYVILDWMLEQDQSYQEVSKRLNSNYWSADQTRALRYTVEEACDVAHLEIYYGSPQPNVLLSDNSTELGDAFFMLQEEFYQLYTGRLSMRTPEENAMHLALRYFLLKHAGLDEARMERLEANVAYYKDQMNFDQRIRELFDDMLVLFEAANDYMKLDEQRSEVERYWAKMSESSVENP